MLINQELCISCGQCVPYCPVNAITVTNRKAHINAELCVECSCCKRSRVCPKNAIEQDHLEWPRAVRSVMSDVFTVFEGTNVSGRGTEEMKTNDVTGRFRPGWVGVAVEVGRPIAAATFRQVQEIAMTLASTKLVQFEPCNPITTLMTDNTTGQFKEEILDERVYSAILEFSVPIEKLPDVLELCGKAASKTQTLFSLDVCSVTTDDQHEKVAQMIRDAGITTLRPNGKVNLGLGKPAAQL